MKHEEEMSRLKNDYEKQLNRKNKRHSAFDTARDFNRLVGERDGLRDLSLAFRQVLTELARCVATCEDDINSTLFSELQQQNALPAQNDTANLSGSFMLHNTSFGSSLNQSRRFVPAVHTLLEVVDSPQLKEFLSNKNNVDADDFDLKECLERLNAEAVYLLQLSEEITHRRRRQESDSSHSSGGEKQDDVPEHEQQLKCQMSRLSDKFVRANSLKEQRRNAELGTELDSLQRTVYNEGYGLGVSAARNTQNFTQLQERARTLLLSPTGSQKQQMPNDTSVDVLQMIEDFCREGDTLIESNKKEREDLQAQVDAADKQLRATRQFLEEQAAEREQERDEFLREIEGLKSALREKEKQRSSFENASKDKKAYETQILKPYLDSMESQIRELQQKLTESNGKRDKFEMELKASIDKIFVLRQIISDLETQIETKALNEHTLTQKVAELEVFINTQAHYSDALQCEVDSLKKDIDVTYQERIRLLEEKLQNVRPSAEQSVVLEQLIAQIRDMETTLDQKTKILETLHHSTSSSNSCSLSATEDVSVNGCKQPQSQLPCAISGVVSPPPGSPVHPSPRQHSLSMEGVQRLAEKLSKHTRVEEATIKRIKDMEMQIANLRASSMELQHERDSLQERMSEQMQRITTLQSRLEDQRKRAEQLERSGISNLNLKVHDLQNELRNVKETLSSRDKQITNLKQQLEKSKETIDGYEAELVQQQQPSVAADAAAVTRLEQELKQKELLMSKLKHKMQSERLQKLALPDLMELVVADKNDEIDHLQTQLKAKEQELLVALDAYKSQAQMPRARVTPTANKNGIDAKDELSNKLSARTLSDILSISEFEEPDVVRRDMPAHAETPFALPLNDGMFQQQSVNTSKEAIANLTEKRTEELAVFAQLQDATVLGLPSGCSSLKTPLAPRQIDFSAFKEDSSNLKQSTPGLLNSMNSKPNLSDTETQLTFLQSELQEAKQNLETMQQQRSQETLAREQELKTLQEQAAATQTRLCELEQELAQKQKLIEQLEQEQLRLQAVQAALEEQHTKNKQLVQQIENLNERHSEMGETLNKHEKNLLNYQQNEQKYLQRIAELESKMHALEDTDTQQQAQLQQQLRQLTEMHTQCKTSLEEHTKCKAQLDALNQSIKAKDERVLLLTTQLSAAEERAQQLQQQAASLEKELEKLRNQLQQSDSSSKQFSVDEIARKVEKELNYSAQLDSSILKAIESEEENNLDREQQHKHAQSALLQETAAQQQQHGTDDENFMGERELLNQLEALRAQIQVEQEQTLELRQELLAEKQHSQDIQEQDVVIIEALRKRLETALLQEDELHKLLDQEREKCERLQAQVAVLQRSETRRNNSLLKSPNESPNRTPRSSDMANETAERLRSEIKLLNAQNEHERERIVDLQQNLERERMRFENELKDRVGYCEKLKKEMEKLLRDKEFAEQQVEYLQGRLTLQSQEIESLEARIATLQQAETRRAARQQRQLQEATQTAAELQELKARLATLETERETHLHLLAQLRLDLERSAARETKLADALANSAHSANTAESSIPAQFMQKMKDINAVLAEHTQENRQMAATVSYLVEERRQLQQKCEALEAQLANAGNVHELEERCNQLFGRCLRIESHRKALVYQKRYLKTVVQSYEDADALTLAATARRERRRKGKRFFKTVALAIIAIQRMKYIGMIWKTGKRIVSKSVFTITQQKCPQLTSQMSSKPIAEPTTQTKTAVNAGLCAPTGAAASLALAVPQNYGGAGKTTHLERRSFNSSSAQIITANARNAYPVASAAARDGSSAGVAAGLRTTRISANPHN